MNLWFDLKYAWRLLIKSSGLFADVRVVVALSVGLAVWTYALAYSQALKPLPFPDSETLVQRADRRRMPRATPRPTVDAYT